MAATRPCDLTSRGMGFSPDQPCVFHDNALQSHLTHLMRRRDRAQNAALEILQAEWVFLLFPHQRDVPLADHLRVSLHFQACATVEGWNTGPYTAVCSPSSKYLACPKPWWRLCKNDSARLYKINAFLFRQVWYNALRFIVRYSGAIRTGQNAKGCHVACLNKKDLCCGLPAYPAQAKPRLRRR
jgi:hypothetical protein